MTSLRKHALIALTILGLGSAALAARAEDASAPPAGRHAHAANQEQMRARMGEMWAKHQAKLHDLLKLTAAQEPAWATYQSAIKPVPHTGEHAALSALSAPERLGKMIEMAKQHTSTMEGHLAALNTFYASLTAEQKAVFDAHTMGGAKAPRHRMGMMHHG
ncbi:MAG: Spy/CpxP family protein refolding chaperone [Sphingomonadaceae bacterium]